MITKKERIGKRGHSFTFFRHCSKENCNKKFIPTSPYNKICESCMQKARQRQRARCKMTNIRTMLRKAKDLGINYKVVAPKRIMLTVQPKAI